MKVSKLVIKELVFHILPKTALTLGLVRRYQEACVWQPPQETKKPMDPLPGQLSSTQVAGSSRLMPLPNAYNHSQKQSVALSTSSFCKTFLTTTEPWLCRQVIQPASSSNQKVLSLDQFIYIVRIHAHNQLIDVAQILAAGHPHPQHSLRCHDGGVRDLVHGRAARVGEGIFREDHKAVRASVRDCWRLRSLLRSLSTPKWSNTSSFCSLCQDWPSSTYLSLHSSPSSSAPSTTKSTIVIGILFVVMSVVFGIMHCLKPAGTESLLTADD